MKIKNRCVMCRALSVILALLMLLTVMPLTVVAEETETRTFETGDIIGFGSYPQSEITDEELKNALTAAAGSTDKWTSYNYYISGTQSDYMKYTDVEYDGEKYRGVYFTQYRPYYTTGSSSSTCQDDNGYSTSTIYWFKYEPMKWQVLSYDSTTGEAVVLSKSIIDSQQYYYTTSSRTIDGKTVYANNYEHSDIRTWLNDTFYNTAFSASEKNAIVATTLDNSAYSTDYSKYDSNSTTDNVWLLSYSEVQKADYGFVTDTGYDFNRMAAGTAYALCQGLWKDTSNGCTNWRLRSAGGYYDGACDVDYDGCVDDGDYGVYSASSGVRPALKLNLTSEISPSCAHTWQSETTEPTCTDNGSKRTFCEDCGGAKIEYIPALGHDFTEKVIDSKHLSLSATKTSPAMYFYGCSRCGAIGTEKFADGEPLQDGEYNKTGDIVAFGSYPQSEVTDETLKSALTAAAGSTDGWTSYGYYSGNEETEEPEQSDYMKYTDIEYNGAKYCGVYFTQYRPYYTNCSSSEDNSYQNNNGYNVSTVYWFKYEPMEWQVLSYDSTTGEAIVLSKDIIDSQQYCYTWSERTIDEKTVYANNYEHSDIRTWLNDTFYNTAFGTSEKNAIVATTLDNSAYSTSYSQYDSDSTTDNVWLLSYSEAQNTAYGFTSDYYDAETRQATGTAYALCQGLWKYTSNGCSYWRLRSAGSFGSQACRVDCDGWVYSSSNVHSTDVGVRPALKLNLTSEIFPSCAHTWQSETTEPTCTERGFTTYSCTKCSESYKDNFTDALGHDFSEKIIDEAHLASAATATSAATYYYDCSRCDTVGTETFTADSSTTEPTTKPSEESTTKPSEETTAKPSEESTTKPSEETTAKPSTEPTTEPTTKPTTEPTTESTAEPTVAPTTAKRETDTETESTTKHVTVPTADIIASVAEKVDTVKAAKTEEGSDALVAVYGTNAAAVRNAASGAKIVDKDGKDVSDTAPLATGMKIVLDGETVEIAVLGDVDGNGEISVTDARLALRQAVSLEKLEGVYLLAAKVGSDAVSVSEARKILRAAVGLDKSDSWLADIK